MKADDKIGKLFELGIITAETEECQGFMGGS